MLRHLIRTCCVCACAGLIAACGSSSTATTSHATGSPIAAAAQQLASQDGIASEAGALTTDLDTLNALCVETPQTLVTEIYDSEQDLKRHAKRTSGAELAAALVADTRGNSAKKPVVCNLLLGSYLLSHGG